MDGKLRARMEKAVLLKVLTSTQDATKKGKHATLKCYLLALEGVRLTVAATDLEISIVDDCPVLDPIAPGRVLVPAETFRATIKALPESELELQVLDNWRLEIRSGESLSRLAGFDPANFPEIQEPTGDSFKVWAEDLGAIAGAVSHAVCTDEDKINILGCRFAWENEVLVGLGTDGHRLALAGKRLEGSASLFAAGVTIPSKGLDAINKLEGELEIFLSFSEDQKPVMLHVVQGGFRLAVCLPAGIWPDARAVIPEDLPSIFAADAEELAEAIARVRIFASQGEILLELMGETLVLKAESEKGEGLDAIECQGANGPGLEIRLNSAYLLDAVGSLGSGQIFIKYRDGASSIVLLPANLSGFDERVLVLMPRHK